MHVHGNQINPNAQLDALYSAQRAAAKQEAARTRKKLSEFASEVGGEAESEEGCVVKLGGGEADEEAAERQKRPRQGGGKRQEGAAGAEEANESISDWA